MRFAAFQSVDVCQAGGCYWLPTPVLSSPFLVGLHGFSLTPSPVLLRNRVHPLVRSTPLQSAPILTCPGLASQRVFEHARSVPSELLPWGCVPSSRHQPAASLQRSSTFAAIRPRRFARPRRFVPPLTLRVYFTPLPRSGFYPSGLSPPSTAEPIRHRSVPSRRLAMVTYVRLPARASFHGPALRALFRAKSPLRSRQCYPTHRPLPSWAFSSSRFSISTPLEAPSCLLPPMAFRRFRESSPMTFSVLPV
jgi:hypothetical protein